MFNSTPKVSIIIPVYNVKGYLRKCLESCVNQTMQDLEVMVVDDCSTDGSDEIIAEYRDEYPTKIKSFKTPCNSRQGAARNIGIKNASGEFLCFVDGDDYIDYTMCEKLYAFAKDNDSDLVYCDGYICDGVDIKTQVRVESYHVENKILNRFTSQCFQIIKRKIIVDNDLFYPENIFCEDTSVVPLWLLFAKNPIKLDIPFYYQVIHADSTSSKMTKSSAEDMVRALEILVLNAKRVGVCNKYKTRIDAFIFNRILVYLYIINGNEYEQDSEENIKAFWKEYQFDIGLFDRFFTIEDIRLVEDFFDILIIGKSTDYSRGGNPELIKKLKEYEGQLVIAGAGKRGKEVAELFLKNGLDYFVCDSDCKKVGTMMENTEDTIHSIEYVKDVSINPLFLVSSHIHFEAIKKTLDFANKYKVIDFWHMVECAEYELIR